jgi:hemerythrin-like domain-containing protein
MPAPLSDPVKLWHEEHSYFRRLLALLEKQLHAFHVGERPNYELMLDVLAYLRGYADDVHHPRENVAFACLAKRVPGIELALARLQQEHRVIARAGEILFEQLSAVLDGTVVPREAIEMSAATYLVYYGNHIAKEEEDVLGKAGEALTAEDWEAVRRAVPERPDPLFGHTPEERYRELRRRIALES